MTKRILFLIFFSICFLYQAQQNLIQIKKEILTNVKTIQNNYENKSLSEIQISNFFCENFYCSICETDSLESNISNKQITNYLKDIIPFFKNKHIKEIAIKDVVKILEIKLLQSHDVATKIFSYLLSIVKQYSLNSCNAVFCTFF